MRTEVRFLLAVVLMIAVLIITNVMFPPVPPAEVAGPIVPDSTLATVVTGVEGLKSPGDEPTPGVLEVAGAPEQDPLRALLADSVSETPAPEEEEAPAELELEVRVEGPLYSFTFSSRGARLVSARLPDFSSVIFEGGAELVHPEGDGVLGSRVLVGGDTLDLRTLPFEVEPAEGLILEEGGGTETLRFSYQHPTHAFAFEVIYTFRPEEYVVGVDGRVSGVDAEVLFTDLGTGIPFNDQRERDRARTSAYVMNHIREGIRSQLLTKVDGPRVEEGPFYWAAFKSKYFVMALLAGHNEDEELYLGGLVARDVPADEFQVSLTATQSVSADGTFGYRFFLGPLDFNRLLSLGTDMQNVNPYGWKFMQPVVRPIVGIIMTILTFLHQNLHIGYGWVLILFGVMMRVVLFPLNHKAMKAQMRNMAAQPLMQEIQAKYKDNPEKLQKEMMKLHKEHGFNPLAGCLPMLLPWPVLIALFFVFQNTIELRGVAFLWLPDLSGPDPLFILPIFLGVSMFLLQWVSMRTMPQQNQQMKMMMYLMPIMMVFIFFNLASGLNLYYATANIATLPQQIWIAGERKKVQAKAPLTLSE
jgi:YidC/Oxa1 family membrane protein insertase